MTRQEMAAIMMADGPWERRPKCAAGKNEWYSDPSPSWDWDFYEYRVKPRPKVLWVNEYGNGSCRAHGSKGEAQRSFLPSANARCAVRYVESPEE